MEHTFHCMVIDFEGGLENNGDNKGNTVFQFLFFSGVLALLDIQSNITFWLDSSTLIKLK